MIRLGDTSFWLDPTAAGWILPRTYGGKPPERFGPFTSPRHALQQRVVELPKGAAKDLRALADLADPDQVLEDLPAPPE